MKVLHYITVLILLVVFQINITGQQYVKKAYGHYPKNAVNSQKLSFLNSPHHHNSSSIKSNFADVNMSSIDEPMLFPYLEQTDACEAFPISLSNGNILMIWKDYDQLYCSMSSDTGMTWDTPILMVVGNACSFISGICTSTGRIICIWQEFSGLVISFSDNHGLSWSPFTFITNDPEDRLTTITQTLDGKLWLTYSRANPGVTNNDIYYRTSIDDGLNWSNELLFAGTPSNEVYCSVVSGPPGSIIAIYGDDANGWDIYMVRSSNGGATWSAPSPIINSELRERTPRVLRQANGDLWIIYEMLNPAPVLPTSQWDIYYTQSLDGGNSWTPSQQFTQYVGYDRLPAAYLINDQPFVSFASWRWTPFVNSQQIWYGIIGTTQDNDLPPAVFGSMIVNNFADSLIDVLAGVDDESGVSDVKLSYTLNGVNYNNIQMFDDGLHNDWDPGDNVWGEVIGPFPPGMVRPTFTVTDLDLNEIIVEAYRFEIKPIHNIGNVLLNFQTSSQLADPDLTGTNFYWPAVNGNDYLYLGGFWVGTNSLGDVRVNNTHYNNDWDWSWTEESLISLEPGLSDQDGNITFGDHNSQSPSIGLTVNQKSYQWSNPSRDDFIIFNYTITNTGLNGNLNDLYSSVWLDPDIGNYDENLGGYDAERKLIYLYNSQGMPGGYLGLKLLDAGSSPHTASVGRPDMNDDDRFLSMTAGIIQPPVDPDDYNLLLTAQPFDLVNGDSASVTFGMVMGESLLELQANADTMENIYNSILVSVENVSSDIVPKEYSLLQNYPNPFNPTTTIKYSIPRHSGQANVASGFSQSKNVTLKIYDILGREVATLVNAEQKPGNYEVVWDASSVSRRISSGVYFYQLITNDFHQTKKLLLIK